MSHEGYKNSSGTHQSLRKGSSEDRDESNKYDNPRIFNGNNNIHLQEIQLDYDDQENNFEEKVGKNAEISPDFELNSVPLYCWWYFILFLLCASLCIILGCMGTPRWVSQGKDNTKWMGGMLRCGGCSGSWEDDLYIDIVKDSCDDNDYSGFCSTFKDLKNAGIIYAVLEAVCLGVLVVWIYKVIMLVRGLRFLSDTVSILIAVFALCLHGAAIGAWYGVTGAKYGSCDDVSTITDSYDVCANHGPILSIVVGCLILITVIIFTSILKRRYKAKEIIKEVELA